MCMLLLGTRLCARTHVRTNTRTHAHTHTHAPRPPACLRPALRTCASGGECARTGGLAPPPLGLRPGGDGPPAAGDGTSVALLTLSWRAAPASATTAAAAATASAPCAPCSCAPAAMASAGVRRAADACSDCGGSTSGGGTTEAGLGRAGGSAASAGAAAAGRAAAAGAGAADGGREAGRGGGVAGAVLGGGCSGAEGGRAGPAGGSSGGAVAGLRGRGDAAEEGREAVQVRWMTCSGRPRAVAPSTDARLRDLRGPCVCAPEVRMPPRCWCTVLPLQPCCCSCAIAWCRGGAGAQALLGASCVGQHAACVQCTHLHTHTPGGHKGLVRPCVSVCSRRARVRGSVSGARMRSVPRQRAAGLTWLQAAAAQHQGSAAWCRGCGMVRWRAAAAARVRAAGRCARGQQPHLFMAGSGLSSCMEAVNGSSAAPGGQCACRRGVRGARKGAGRGREGEGRASQVAPRCPAAPRTSPLPPNGRDRLAHYGQHCLSCVYTLGWLQARPGRKPRLLAHIGAARLPATLVRNS